MTGSRRAPVPRAWRDEHHDLSTSSRIAGGGWGGRRRVYRAGGRCSCGSTFGTTAGNHRLNAAEVREQWLDHVAAAYLERS